MAKSKVTTFTPKKSDPQELHDFFDNQTNKADAIRYIVMLYIKEHGTGDVQEVKNKLLYGTPVQIKNKEETLKEQTITQEIVEQPAEEVDIPNCYE